MQRFLECRRGNFTIAMALMCSTLFCAVGLAVDYANAGLVRSKLQQAADAAALAGMALSNSPTDVRTEEAKRVFADNIALSGYADPYKILVAVEEIVSNVSAEKLKLTVDVSYSMPTQFNRVVGIDKLPIRVKAISAPKSPTSICLLALNKTAAESIKLQGTADLLSSGCSVQANSASPNAIAAGGSSKLKAARVCAVGGGAGNITPALESGCRSAPDPLASLPLPTKLTCDFNNIKLSKGSWTAYPGVYCGGLELATHAEVKLEPGVYVMKDGPFVERAQAKVTGDGVTIYLYGTNARLNVVAGSDLSISAPKTGPYRGVAIAQHAASSVGQTSELNGGGTVNIVGAVYLPTQTLEIGGNSGIGAGSPYMPLIADKFYLRGNGTVKTGADHVAAGFSDVLPFHQRTVMLVR